MSKTNGVDTSGEAMLENANGQPADNRSPVKTHSKSSLDCTTKTNNSVAYYAVTTGVTADSELELTITKTEPRVDSRLLAKHLCNKHKAVMSLFEKYAEGFKTFGILPFKKEVFSGRGQPERYAILNEDQANFLLSLSRNSETVVCLKVKLIKAFSAARKAADLRQVEYLPGYHRLHDQMHTLALEAGSTNENRVHCNVNKLLNKFSGIESGQRPSASCPQQALLIVGQMAAYRAAQGAPDHHVGYQCIKSTLATLAATLMLEVAS